MDDIHDDWLKWPETCCAIVTKQWEEGACGKPAVAVAIYNGEEFDPHEYPVCRHHARGRPMLPLADIIKIIKETR